jgi:release factor glutamine methyltransferase
MNINKIFKNNPLPKSTSSRLDLELLLIKVLQKKREFLYTYPTYELTEKEEITFQQLYQQRLRGVPIAYIIGYKEFYSLKLMVNLDVLIPRSETELVVEVILNKLDSRSAEIADLGTGSGAIALAIATMRPKWKIIATDISNNALQVAKSNAGNLNIKNVKFYLGDWCDALPKKKLDAIVSNPPYVDNNDIHLKTEDIKHEPKIALVAGDGLIAIKTIIQQAKTRLRSGGLLILEHGHDQAKTVQKLLLRNGYQEIISFKDLAFINRVVMAKLI